MLGLDGGREREHERFILYCELVARARCVRIRAGRADTPARIAEALREHLAAASQSMSGTRG